MDILSSVMKRLDLSWSTRINEEQRRDPVGFLSDKLTRLSATDRMIAQRIAEIDGMLRNGTVDAVTKAAAGVPKTKQLSGEMKVSYKRCLSFTDQLIRAYDELSGTLGSMNRVCDKLKHK
jgi:hypothetical protein